MLIYPSGISTQLSNKATVNSGRNSLRWASVLALGMGMLIYGVAESYGPVYAISGVIPPNLAFWGYSLPFIAGGIGAFLAGYLADAIGRKKSFIITATMLVAGVAVYSVAQNSLPALLLSFALVGTAAIGLETPTLAAVAEQASADRRGKLLVITQNFGNVGVALAFVPILLGLARYQNTIAISLMFFAPLLALIASWILVNESEPWDAVRSHQESRVIKAWKDRDGEAPSVQPKGGLKARLLTLIGIGVAQDVGFVYVTYGVAYSYFPSLASEVPLIGGFAMTLIGIAAALWMVPKVERKTFAVLSYGLQLILWLLLWIFVDITGSMAGLALLAIITVLFIPVEITWAVRALLEPELFGTERRGLYVSLVRMVVWVTTGIITGILTAGLFSFTFNEAMAITTVVFALGFGAALAWMFLGFETKDKSLLGHDVKSI